MRISLLSLYASVLVPILSDWIKIEDLCFLDTAVCNQTGRRKFLEVLRQCYYSDPVSENENIFDWIMLRDLHVRKFCIGRSVANLIPRIASILTSPHLKQLEGVELDQICFLIERKVEMSAVILCISRSVDYLLLDKFGSLIIKLVIHFLTIDSIYCAVASCCPSLREITAPDDSFILPIVDACELDVINNCHMGSLVQRQKCEWTYSCDLVRTTVVDETAVCLGEGKYYRMTRLNCKRPMSNEDEQLLIPLLNHLTALRLDGNRVLLAEAAAERCFDLTELDVSSVAVCGYELHQLLQRSKLRRLSLHSDVPADVDSLFEEFPPGCRNLESLMLNNCAVYSVSMARFFSQCLSLREFTTLDWHANYGSAFTPAHNLVSLSVGNVQFRRFGSSRKRKLRLSNKVDETALMYLIMQSPGLLSMELECYPLSRVLLWTILESCPYLTSLCIDSCPLPNEQWKLFAALGVCGHLKTLSLKHINELNGITLPVLLRNKSTLLSLTLEHCNVSSDMAVQIRQNCLALTCLDLSYNESVSNGDVIALLKDCYRLERLSLAFCVDVDAAILSSIQSPPMRFLDVTQTRITREDFRGFNAANGVKCHVQWEVKVHA